MIISAAEIFFRTLKNSPAEAFYSILLQACKTLHLVHPSEVSIQEIKTEIEALPAEERKRLAAFLVSLRHKEIADYRTRMAQKIDDKNPENWATLEDLDQRLEVWAMHYRLLISIEVVEFLERLPSKTRKALRNAVAAIGGNPLAMADASDFDDTGRHLQIAIVGDFALTYWIDDADRHVKILDVHSADRWMVGLDRVEYEEGKDVKELLAFYMGKNTS